MTVADVRRPRVVYTVLLVAAGAGSTALTASFWPVLLSLVAALMGWWASATPTATAEGSPDDARTLLARLDGERRRRHFELIQTADEIRTLLSRGGRDASLWAPEMARLDQLVQAHLLLSARLRDDEAMGDDEDALVGHIKDLKLRSPEGDVARELARTEERLELIRARRQRMETRAAHLADIEHALVVVRDRVAAAPDEDAAAQIAELVGGVEAAAAAEIETSRLAAGLSSRGAIAERTGP